MKASRGQSLIETLVAITVLVIGVFGAVYLGVYTIRAAQTSQLDVVAENLAREGIESVRWVRDQNWRQSRSWNDGLADATCYRVKIGNADAPGDGDPSLTPISCFNSQDDRLCLNTNSGQYFHDAEGVDCTNIGQKVIPSAFTRKVTISWKSTHELEATCTVTRDGGIGTVDYTVVENLFDWKQ